MSDCGLSELQSSLERIKDLAVERHRNLSSLPTIALNNPLQSDALRSIPSSIPEQGWGLTKSTDFLVNEIAAVLNPGQAGPRYFGFVTGGVLPSALISDWFTSLYDQNFQIHLPKETASTVIDTYTISMIIQLLGLDHDRFSGTLTTGATSSNLLALICAREETIQRCMYRKSGNDNWSVAEHGLAGASSMPIKIFACQAHASIRKIAALAGIGRANVINVGKSVDSTLPDRRAAQMTCLEFDLEELEKELKRCHEDMSPAIVIIGMGEVVTGALSDQTVEIRQLCDEYGAWLHVDAAFSAFVCLIDGYKWISTHLNMCDSITSDGHKFLNVPYDCGILLVKKNQQKVDSHLCTLDNVCGPGSAGGPAYLSSASSAEEEEQQDAFTKCINSIPSPFNRNLENSSRFRALPLYISLLSQGFNGTTAMMKRNLDFADKLRAWLEDCPYYQVLTPPCDSLDSSIESPQKWKGHWFTAVIFFRAHPSTCPIAAFTDSNTGLSMLITAIKETRKMYVSPGSLNGINGVRIAVSNWSTGLEGDSDLEISKKTLLQVMQQ